MLHTWCFLQLNSNRRLEAKGGGAKRAESHGLAARLSRLSPVARLVVGRAGLKMAP